MKSVIGGLWRHLSAIIATEFSLSLSLSLSVSLSLSLSLSFFFLGGMEESSAPPEPKLKLRATRPSHLSCSESV